MSDGNIDMISTDAPYNAYYDGIIPMRVTKVAIVEKHTYYAVVEGPVMKTRDLIDAEKTIRTNQGEKKVRVRQWGPWYYKNGRWIISPKNIHMSPINEEAVNKWLAEYEGLNAKS